MRGDESYPNVLSGLRQNGREKRSSDSRFHTGLHSAEMSELGQLRQPRGASAVYKGRRKMLALSAELSLRSK